MTLFDRIFRLLLVILPFHVLLSVFLEYKVDIPGVALYKEVALVALFGLYGWAIFQKKISIPVLDRLDYLMIAYVVWMVGVTVFQGLSIANILYGGRYDFIFFAMFFIIRKWYPLLSGKPTEYFRLFLISATIALVLGIVVRFVVGESILLHFGFSANLSNWMFGGSIPIYHGIDGANVRRFQGIFDGPNPAAFFLLMYSGVLAYYFRSAKKYYFLLSLWSIVLVTLLVYTYSRSALIGFCVGMMVFLVLHARTLFQKHWKTLIILGSVFFLLMGFFVVKKEGTLDRIILREGSSRGHFDRSLIGLQRAVDKPLGSGLATSGPAYRYVQHPEEDESLFEGDNKKREDYSIPESWYIQQMVEGGAPGFAIFIAIMWLIFLALCRYNTYIAASFAAVGTMNLFLHSYESVYLSLLLFALSALIIAHGQSTPLRSTR